MNKCSNGEWIGASKTGHPKTTKAVIIMAKITDDWDLGKMVTVAKSDSRKKLCMWEIFRNRDSIEFGMCGYKECW